MRSLKPVSGFDRSIAVAHTYGMSKPEYQRLHVVKYKSRQGIVVACFGMTWKERFRMFFSGKVWLSVMTFDHKLQPIQLSATPLNYSVIDLMKIDEDILAAQAAAQNAKGPQRV